MGAQLQGPPHLRSHSNQQITNKQPHNYSYPAHHPVILCSVGSLLTVLQGLFLSQCLPHSSHTLALLAWEAPDQHDSICLCLYIGLKQLLQTERSCLNLCVSTHFLTCSCFSLWGEISGILWKVRGGHVVLDTKKLRSPQLLSCGV